MDSEYIVIKKANEHNLKDISLTLPRNSLIVFTGVSGSGKSSLAFDTLFKEGQRRFMESLSAYARQFLGDMERPKVEQIEGLSPAISIDQKTINRNPRSTVGTITELYDHLRLLYARLGKPHCPKCGKEVVRQNSEQIADSLLIEARTLQKQLGTHDELRGMILAPIIVDRKGEYRKELRALLADGYLRARIDGKLRDLRESIDLDRYVRHTIEVVLDRIRYNQAQKSRIVEAVEKALDMSIDTVSALIEDHHITFATQRACPTCRISIPEMEPRLFSFNSPHGACPECEGLGEKSIFSPEAIVPVPQLSIADGAIACLTAEGNIPFTGIGMKEIREVVEGLGGSLHVPYMNLSNSVRKGLMYGSNAFTFTYRSPIPGVRARKRPFAGILASLSTAYKYTRAQFLEKWRTRVSCQECNGVRLNSIARSVRFHNKKIWEISSLTIDEMYSFFTSLSLDLKEQQIGREIFKEINARLMFLREVGLGYITLNRSASTLSGGEAQRIRLARQIGSGLQGVLYVLDEPSIGLHPRDNRRLLNTLEHLRNLGNTVVVVEHDRETMEAADYLVEIGPGAGAEGGKIVDAGPLPHILRGNSLTARYLKGIEKIEVPKERRKGLGIYLVLKGASHNNLKSMDVAFPLGSFICVTGVSGSGKSTLVSDTLYPILARKLHKSEKIPGAYREIKGIEHIHKVLEINQSPIGRTPRSNPATYTKVFDQIRALFAELPESRLRGYRPGRFSFNVSGGRCEVCHGSGIKEIEMQFMANVQVRCESCGGRRFNQETLSIRYKGHSIYDILELTVSQAQILFSNIPTIRQILDTLIEVGLGYMKLGQPSTTLSGGEAQRIKLASELSRPTYGHTLYILDEPTTGLHMVDIRKLLYALQKLVDSGNTVIVIEHNLDVIKVADHIIDLGPEGGEFGGKVVAAGPPEAIISCDTHTGRFLREELKENFNFTSFEGVCSDNGPPKNNFHYGLKVRGAHVHNLKHIDVDIPRNSMTVITGVSGSGKTSLAFNTLFAEGQRRYVESLSTYARRFLSRMDRAQIESIQGIAPSISVDQKTVSRSPRSTVATSTEIYDYLRLLFSRVGTPHCPNCGTKLMSYTPEGIVDRLLSEHEGNEGEILTLLSPESALFEKGNDVSDAVENALCLQGFKRVRIDDHLYDIDSMSLPRGAQALRLELVVDRVVLRSRDISRLRESFESAFNLGNGCCSFRFANERRLNFSTMPCCSSCSFILDEPLSPRHFSFNAHIGACPHCDGLGISRGIVAEWIIKGPELPIWQALDPVIVRILEEYGVTSLVNSFLHHHQLDSGKSWNDFSDDERRLFLYGQLDRLSAPVKGTRIDSTAQTTADGGDAHRALWKGLIRILDDLQRSKGDGEGEYLPSIQGFVGTIECPECNGDRLRPLPLSVRIASYNIIDVSSLRVTECLDVMNAFMNNGDYSSKVGLIAKPIVAEIMSRLRFLRDVGLGYLTLDRRSSTLSGGESQRIRLASQLGSRLMGVLYVLDEPTIGLHPRDTQRLL